MPTIRLEAVFIGRVQGVGFRYNAARMATEHGIAGWVRNEPDGSVRCVAEGEEARVAAFVGAVQAVMSRNIRDVRIDRSAATGEFGGQFDIRG